MIIGSGMLIPVFLIMGFIHTSVMIRVPLPPPWSTTFAAPLHLVIAMAMMGIVFSLVPAVIWPSVAYIVEEKTLGTALGLMTMVQNAGMASANYFLGLANDTSHASETNPQGYMPMLYILTSLASCSVLFAVLLRIRETGPRAHGLETITASSQ